MLKIDEIKELSNIAIDQFSVFKTLLFKPKFFLQNTVDGTHKSIRDAILFYFLISIITIGFIPDFLIDTVSASIAKNITNNLLPTLIYTISIYTAWGLFKKKLQFSYIITTSLYIGSISNLIGTFFSSLSISCLMIDSYEQAIQFYKYTSSLFFHSSQQVQYISILDFSESAQFGHNAFSAAGIVAKIIWIFSTWGIYRIWAHTSRTLSATVFCIFLPIELILTIIVSPLLISSLQHLHKAGVKFEAQHLNPRQE